MDFKPGDILEIDLKEGRGRVLLTGYGTVCPISHAKGDEYKLDRVLLYPTETYGYAVCSAAYKAELEKLNAVYVETVPVTVLDEVDMTIAGLNCPEGIFIL